MANVKITELTAATALAGTDVLPIVDVGADATKKVSVSDLLRNLPDGTASAPALAFADDQNTGVLSPGDNSLAFATSGTQRLVIDSSGNCGINETSPGQRLVVGGDMRIGFTTPTDAARSLVFDSNRSSAGATLTNITFNWNSTAVSQIRAIAGADTTNKDDGELAFFTSAANSILERLRIDSSGNVGIGATSVSDRLAVGSSSAEDQRLTIFSSTDGNNDPYGSILFRHSSATGNRNAKISAIRNAGSSGADLTFHTRTHGDATNVDGGEERMRIDSSGNVGIGTSSPSNILSLDDTQASGGVGIDITNQGDGGSSTTPYVFINAKLNPARPGGEIRFGREGVYGSESTADSFMAFYTAVNSTNTERLRINSSGNVLVGKTTTALTTVGTRIDVGSVDCSASSTSTNLGTNSGGSIRVANTDSTDNNFSNIGGYNSNGLVVNQINFINTSHSSRTGEIGFSTHNGSSLTERMRIDSSGNLGVGTSSPAQQDGNNNPVVHLYHATSPVEFRAQRGNGCDAFFTARSAELQIGTNTNHRIEFRTNDTERMRVDTSGRLLVGDSSSHGNGIAQFNANTDSTTGEGIILLCKGDAATAGQSLGQIKFTNSTGNQAAYITGEADTGWGGSGSSDYPGRLIFSTTSDGGSSPTERMRISSQGNLAIGTSSTTRTQANRSMVFTVGTNGDISINHSTSNGSGDPYLTFGFNGTAIGSVTQSGNSAVLYNTTSDYRLKENVVDLDGAIDRVKQLAPKRFNFIVDADKTVDGFLAHEAQTVVPEAVTGTYNEVDADGNPVYQGIDSSKLVPLLTAALQEAIAKIETLETKVAALEAQ